MSIGTEILIIVLLILLNGIFALSEIAIVSARRARLQQRVNEGDQSARVALRLSENPNTFLSTVQIGITLIGVLAGAVGGATLAESLAPMLMSSGLVLDAEVAESLALTVVVLLITFFSILLGELVPKRLGLQYAERIASLVAGPMSFLSVLFRPLVWVMEKSTDMVLRLMRIERMQEVPVTEEELLVQLDQGTQAGVFEEAEQDMVEGVFRLHDRRVFSLMTPRGDVVWLDVTDSPEEIRKIIDESEFSSFPVCNDTLDAVIGIIKARDLLLESLHGEPLRLQRNLRPPTFIPETANASRALEIFKSGEAEMLLVVDEFGSVQGLLTINDILEEIVGDIEDGEPQATQRQDGSWLLDGMITIEDFKEIFNILRLPDEDEYETLGGFLMTQLGRVPKAADACDWNGLHFEVMDMDGNRVDKVLVTTIPVKKPSAESTDENDN